MIKDLSPYGTGEAAIFQAREMLEAYAREFKTVYEKTEDDDKAEEAADTLLETMKTTLGIVNRRRPPANLRPA